VAAEMNQNTASLKFYSISTGGSIFLSTITLSLPEACQRNECLFFRAVNVFPILRRLSISRCHAAKEENEAFS
jgi:hypothetical protein